MSPGSSVLVSKKRKRDVNDESSPPSPVHQLNQPIILQPASAGIHSTGSSFEIFPKLLVPKCTLTNITTPVDRSLLASIFTTSSPIEQLEHGKSEASGYSARTLVGASRDGFFYAVERVQDKLYSLAPLPGWISLETSNVESQKLSDHAHQAHGQDSGEATPWWDKASVTLPTSAKDIYDAAKQPKPSTKISAKHRSRKEASVKLLVEKVEVRIEKPVEPQQEKHAENEQGLPDGEPEPTPSKSFGQTTWEEIASSLRAKYLEALYMSKTSLAYFAKGPLARARNAVLSHGDPSPECSLSSLLAEITMTISMSDKKYSVALPDLLGQIPAGSTSADFGGEVLPAMVKKSKRRKKLSKHGLLPLEEEYLCHFWFEKENDPESAALDLPHEKRIKASLMKQRTRETQLQVMVILESLVAQVGVGMNTDTSARVGELPPHEAAENGDKKNTKSVDLHALLDTLIDRLCIWQTTQEEVGNLFNGGDKASREHAGKQLQGHKSNALQDFCTEVLAPFYASRLPQVFTSLCRKMGTVGATSPARPALKKVPSTSHSKVAKHARPGSTVSRSGLKRVATDSNATSNAARRRTPSLARSSTDSLVAHVKRESTDLLLQDVPMHKPSTLQDRRYSQREVDIAAISKATKARLERKAFLEQELASAIDVLKRPNGRAAVQEFVALADERQAGQSKSTSKRKREPVRSNSSNNVVGGVHVKATPRANRWQGQGRYQARAKEGESTHATSDANRLSTTADEAPPPSDQRIVPSTSKRRLPAEKLLPVIHSAVASLGQRQQRQQQIPCPTSASSVVAATPTRHPQHLGASRFTTLEERSRHVGVESTPSRGGASKFVKLSAARLAGHDAEGEDEEDGEDGEDGRDERDRRKQRSELTGGPSPLPTRFYRLPSSPSSDNRLLAETPIKKQSSRVAFLTPSIPAAMHLSIVEATPSRTGAGRMQHSIDEVRATVQISEAGGREAVRMHDRGRSQDEQPVRPNRQDEVEMDVYKTLGWDSEDDLI